MNAWILVKKDEHSIKKGHSGELRPLLGQKTYPFESAFSLSEPGTFDVWTRPKVSRPLGDSAASF